TLPDVRTRFSAARIFRGRSSVLLLVFCSVLAVALLGYHPYAEDGGIYSSALSLRLDGSLFPAYRGFVIAHTGKSLFIPLVAGFVRWSHLSQGMAMFALYVLSVVATLVAFLRLARVLLPSLQQQRWAVLLLAVTLGMPVGGTSLYLADPYLTARSFSTPLIVLALAMMVQKRYGVTAAFVAASFSIHPLMTLWALLPLAFVLVWQRSSRPVRDAALVGAIIVGTAGVLQWLLPADSAAARAASLSRSYWFLSEWQWYEWIGLIAPCILLLTFLTIAWREDEFRNEAQVLACAMTAAMLTVTTATLLWIHTSNAAFLLARVQPLRLLHPVYLVFLLLLAGWFAKASGNSWRSRTAFVVLLMGATAGLVFLQRTTYPNSAPMEVPWRESSNGYEQAARWVREHTPRNAVIATDAQYTTAHGEDAQMVRAIALRSTVPDAAKDGGIASVVPVLANEWMTGSTAQEGLAKATDAVRVARVKPLGASWLLLPTEAATRLPCPYANTVAKVCRIP
ncbi:MAG TPA: hypothetical protein VIM67_12915, partial [Terriglobus sp.]